MGKIKNLLIEAMETPIMIPCPDCIGIGTIELDVYRPHGPNRDIGYIDTRKVVCETCNGDGEIERLCDCGEPVTKIMGEDAEVCMECLACKHSWIGFYMPMSLKRVIEIVFCRRCGNDA